MISRKNRFHGRSGLNYVYKRGRSVRGPLMSLKYAPSKGHTDYRLAVVVSRKVNKSAVVRNRIRRRLYEDVRHLAEQFSSVNDQIIVVYSDELADLSAVKLSKMVRRLFEQADIIQPVAKK
ncbi:MAG: ribonuclease P protein component [Candidatus Saccharimonadales bacterium]